MKNLLYILWVLAFLTSLSCKKEESTGSSSVSSKYFSVDMWSDYQNDLVSVYIDNNKIFSKRVTSNAVLGVAEIFRYDLKPGKHILFVEIPEKNTRHDSIINFQDTITIAVIYLRDVNRIEFRAFHQRMMYD
jgi:hypothetical protein